MSENYDLVRINQQEAWTRWAGSGPLDILAVKKDKSELVIELKGQASDEVVGQITRYMGGLKDVATDNQEVKA